jgi:hypothetical protein
MIVVFDTNVLVSALLSPRGAPAMVVDLWEEEVFDLAISIPLLDELSRVLDYERVKKYFKQHREKTITLIKRIRTAGIMVDPQFELDVIADDPDDNRILACAVASSASYIISGDDYLLDLEKYKGIVVLPPAGFLALLEAAGKRKG